MNTRLQTAFAIAALGTAAATLSTGANACNLTDYRSGSSALWSLPSALPNALAVDAAAQVEASAAMQASPTANRAAVSAANLLQQLEPITGLWKFTFTSKNNVGIPNGAQLDAGFVTWHADGTEIMNSGRAPMTGSFCMGVFRHTSVYGYKLNHYALSWDATGTKLIGPTNIREQLQLGLDGNTYTGSVVITQFDTHGNSLGSVNGLVLAKRLTADTP
jgi:hypothetical protein